MAAAAAVAGLAPDVLEMDGGILEREAPGLPPADHVTPHALGVAIGAVADQGVEGTGVVGELPGFVLCLVADVAELVAAVARRVKQHGSLIPGQLGEPHSHQRRLPLGAPSLGARNDGTVRIDQEGDRNPSQYPVAGADRAVGVQQDREEIELILRELLADTEGAVQRQYPHQDRTLRLGDLSQRLPEEAERVVAVRAAGQEEHQYHGLSAQRRQIEALASVEPRGAEQWCLGTLSQHGDSGRILPWQSQPPPDLRFDQGRWVLALTHEARAAADQVPAGIGHQQGDRRADVQETRQARPVS